MPSCSRLLFTTRAGPSAQLKEGLLLLCARARLCVHSGTVGTMSFERARLDGPRPASGSHGRNCIQKWGSAPGQRERLLLHVPWAAIPEHGQLARILPAVGARAMTEYSCRRALLACIAALLVVTTSGYSQDKIQTKVNVPELCGGDSAAVFLGFAVREIRAARVFATTQKQRLALLELEAATVAQLDQAPLLRGDKEVVYGIFQKEDQGWERGMREVAEASPKRDMMLRESYRHYLDAASQELGVKCHGRLHWPVLQEGARKAAAL